MHNTKRALFIITVLLVLGAALAQTSSDIEAKFAPDMDWFSAGEAANAVIQPGLSEREAELYREAFALGHYHALHPEHLDNMYVLNTRTKRYHFSDCKDTLLIDTENREHSTLSKEELEKQNYKPCGNCKP